MPIPQGQSTVAVAAVFNILGDTTVALHLSACDEIRLSTALKFYLRIQPTYI